MNKIKEMLEKYKHKPKKISIVADDPKDQESADRYALYLNAMANQISESSNRALKKIIESATKEYYEKTHHVFDYTNEEDK